MLKMKDCDQLSKIRRFLSAAKLVLGLALLILKLVKAMNLDAPTCSGPRLGLTI